MLWPLALTSLAWIGSASGDDAPRSTPKSVPVRVDPQNSAAVMLQNTLVSFDVNTIDGSSSRSMRDIIDRPQEKRDTVVLLNDFMRTRLMAKDGALYQALKNEKREKGGRIVLLRENKNLSFGAGVGLKELTRAVGRARGVDDSAAFINTEVWAPKGFRLLDDGGDATAINEILCTVFESEARALVGTLRQLLEVNRAVKTAA